MILQNILWPSVDTCMQEKMYFRCNQKTCRIEDTIYFEKGGNLFSDTYFNSVSIDKWYKYTNINSLGVSLKLRGSFRVRLLYKKKIHDHIFSKIAAEKLFTSETVKDFSLIFPQGEGMAFFSLEALEDDSQFWGGNYTTDFDDLVRDVKIAIGICTFKREAFVSHNLDILNRYILNNNQSELNGNLEVFVSDNGHTLEIEKLSNEYVHIFKNRNVGGAGGFTRDLIEIINSNTQGNRITHVLLMDDDIIISPESLFRTYRILTLIKDEYINAFIGGAMLRNDAKNIQVESGASWNAGRLISLKASLDLVSCDACLYNEIEEYTEYNAWWYCCFPVTVVNEKNLPMPIFIRGDDLEYGLRNMQQLILMNGICVWHEPFENKYSSFLFYYILRNQFIDNALHFLDYRKKQAKKQVFINVAREIAFYRYKNVDLILRGVEDFLEGIDWLIETDGESLHKAIMAAGYKAQPVESLQIPFSYPVYEHSLIENDFGKKKMLRFLTLNGYLLKTTRDNIVSMSLIRPYNAYRAKKILNYDITTHKGFITQKSMKEAIRCTRNLFRVLRKMNHRYDVVAAEYNRRQNEVQNLNFWNNYLGLQKRDFDKRSIRHVL